MNIVLVHGILGFNRIGPVEYFRGVAEHFRQQGHLVVAPILDPTQGIAYRGAQLRDQVTAALNSGTLDPAQLTHIMAHSMGGLDSRWMLSPANPGRIGVRIRSLTTIGTPHRGSPIADLLDHPGDLAPFPHLPFGAADNLFTDTLNELGISLNGLRDLTTQYCQQVFNPTYSDNPDVAYFSVAGRGRTGFPPVSAPLLLFHHYIAAKTGHANDGLVAVTSAPWGTFDPTPWPSDHTEEVGWNLDNLSTPPDFP